MKYLYITLASIIVNALALTPEDAKKIGMQTWHNEASKRKELLVFWSQHESFPSFGIGHNIWFPEGQEFSFTEEFPLLIDYFKKHGVKLPQWLLVARKKGAPWASRAEFLADKTRTEELRTILSKTIDLQTNFMIDRLNYKWPAILKAIPKKKLSVVKKNIQLLQSSILGNYALIDYLNFKGDGLNPQEEVCGQRWGLTQVLMDMPDNLTIESAPKAFSIAASKMLVRLIENSAPHYSRIKYLYPWIRRVSGYSDPNLFK